MARLRFLFLAASIFLASAHAQIIDFESNGLKYKTMTRGRVTIMFAALPTHIRDYAILQIAISNGSALAWSFKPEDFHFERSDGQMTQALPAVSVVNNMMEKASRGDVIKLVTAYENYLYGNSQLRTTNGYETRRQNALADIGSTKLKAAAAASAIVLANTKLLPGDSTDGAIFYANQGKPLGPGKLIVNAAGETFVFPIELEAPQHGTHN